MISGFREKEEYLCDSCRDPKSNARVFTWKLNITEEELEICQKCAERESGKKYIKRLING
ncbi:hypothetical protein HN803_03630 [candidate division WWE3 bacterium]|jgi:hypothetical protein|nr:hypothetical protein [candidate division WWE3 bacterium]